MDLSPDAFFRFVRGIAMALQRGWTCNGKLTLSM